MDEVVTRTEYVTFVFIAAVGVLQLVAARTQMKGLLFFNWRPLDYFFSLAAIAGSFWWFFVRDARIDTVMRTVGLEGAQQFYFFCLAAFLAIVFTLAVSSIIWAFRPKAHSMENPNLRGLSSLKEMSYLQALRRSFKSGVFR